MLAALAMEMSGSEFELLVADQLIVNRIMSASPLALRTLSLQMTKLSNSYAQAPSRQFLCGASAKMATDVFESLLFV